MCKSDYEIGGYPQNFVFSENGQYRDIDSAYFEKMQKDYSILKKGKKSFIRKIDFEIKHENVDLAERNLDVIIIIDNNYIVYNSKYESIISTNIEYESPYYANITFYILDQKSKTVHKFASELAYPLFKSDVKVLKVVLLKSPRYFSGNELQYFYKITNLKSEVEENK